MTITDRTRPGVARTAAFRHIDHFAPVKTREDAGDARVLRLLTTEGPSRVKAETWKRLAPTA